MLMLNKLDEKRGKEGEIMLYTTSYTSPLGKILLAADEEGLTGVWFEGEKYLVERSAMSFVEKETPVLRDARRWLDRLGCRTGQENFSAHAGKGGHEPSFPSREGNGIIKGRGENDRQPVSISVGQRYKKYSARSA